MTGLPNTSCFKVVCLNSLYLHTETKRKQTERRKEKRKKQTRKCKKTIKALVKKLEILTPLERNITEKLNAFKRHTEKLNSLGTDNTENRKSREQANTKK